MLGHPVNSTAMEKLEGKIDQGPIPMAGVSCTLF